MSARTPQSQRNDPFLFFVIAIWVFACSLFLLNSVGFVPYYVSGEAPTASDTVQREYLTNEEAAGSRLQVPGIGTNQPEPTPGTQNPVPIPGLPSATITAPGLAFLPERIIIPGLNKELTVVNPVSSDVATLDRELLDAVVRYPGSGLLNEDGNIFIFGHSSRLRTVHNPMFKAFNGIETLPTGSLVQLIAEGRVYVYQIIKQEKVSADTALVNLVVRPGERLLTLSTCNSFGEKSDRFVVTARFTVSYIQQSGR